jgi:hypothetical protein
VDTSGCCAWDQAARYYYCGGCGWLRLLMANADGLMRLAAAQLGQ